jgi:myosin heavy subunit
MKFTNALVIAALLSTDMQGANAIRRHHRHHHHPHFVQLDKPNEDILKKDPKYEELQKKKVAIQDAIEEETAPKELTEEEEKEKLDKEITTLQKEGEKVAAETKLKDAKKSLKALELEEKQSGTPQAQKKAELTKLAGQYEEDLGKAAGALKEEDAKNEEKKEKSEKIKDLEASLKEVVDKQEKEVVALDKVRAKIANIVDEPKPVEADPVSNPKPKADLTAFQSNLKKIEQEEEKKEAEIEARKAAVKAIPPNPVVAAAEAAQEAHEAEMKKKFAEEKAAEEAAEKAAEARAAALAKARAERAATIKGNDELWVANMPPEVLNSFVQTKVNEIRQQLAQVEAREDSDSDSSDSDSDDE